MEISSLACPKCGVNIPEQIKQGNLFKCTNCGSTLVWPDKKPTLMLSFGARLCPNCGVDNEQTRRFCRNCGGSLTKICPICQSVYYTGDNFCPEGHDYEKEQNRKDVVWYLNKAEQLARSGNFEQAAQVLETAFTSNPGWASRIAGYPVQTSLGQTEPASGYGLLAHLASKSNRSLAIRYIVRMVELIPDNPGHARQAAREAQIADEVKKITQKMGVSWKWWEY